MALAVLPRQMIVDTNGVPRVAAKLYFYQAGTTTPITVYTTVAYGPTHPSPVVSVSDGFFPAIYVNPAVNATYKMVAKDSAGVTIWTEDNIPALGFAVADIGAILYPISSAEQSAGVTISDYSKPWGWFDRYGADLTGATDSSAAWNRAVSCNGGGTGKYFHPGGTIKLTTGSISNLPNDSTLCGSDMKNAIFSFTGDGNGITNSNTINSSGYGRVAIRDISISGNNTTNAGAGLNLSAGGYAHYYLTNVRVSGFKYSLVCDQPELFKATRFTGETSISGGRIVWLTGDSAWRTSEAYGFTNILTFDTCQLSGGQYNIVDDGGNGHTFINCNCDGASIPVRFAGVSNLNISGGSLETQLTTGTANALFSNLTVGGTNVGPCVGVKIGALGFYGNMSAGYLLSFESQTYTVTGITKAASAVITISTVSTANPFFVNCPVTISGVVGMTEINLLTGYVSAIGGSSGAWTLTVNINSTGFTNYASGGVLSCYHAGVEVGGCTFGNQTGRSGAVNVQYLANSKIGPNVDQALSGFHYGNVHNDVLANGLLAPQNGTGASLGTTGATYGDTRYANYFPGGIGVSASNAKMTALFYDSKTFDWPSIAAGGNSNTTVTVNGVALGDKVIDVSMSLNIGTTAVLHAHVESSNTVRVILQNLDGVSALDLASGTLSVTVGRFS